MYFGVYQIINRLRSQLAVNNNLVKTFKFDNGDIVDIAMKEGEIERSNAYKLLPDEIRERLPKLYETEEIGLLAVAIVKFFSPDGGWTWYASEFDGEDIFFGLVDGFETELGYFSLSELQEIRGSLGLPIERDLYYQPKTLKALIDLHKNKGSHNGNIRENS